MNLIINTLVMIANVFEVLARQLDAYFQSVPLRKFHNSSDNSSIDWEAESPGGDRDPSVKILSFLQQEDQQEYIKFKLNRVTPILINIEEEGNLRPADRFSRVSNNGKREEIWPDVRLNLYILFVSHFYDYTDSLYYMGLIVKYFQSHPILDHKNTPHLHQDIDKLILELVTLPFAQQNEVWNALRSAYHPSLLYKVKMLVFQDQPSITGAEEIKTIHTETRNLE